MKGAPASFDLITKPVERGVTLLEASAGTGKTFTLAGIVLRLLVETPPDADTPLSIDQILVVTYTEAATAELRGRIRERIAGALAAFISGTSSDALLQRWLDTWPENSPERRRATQRLEAALRNFDLAPIFTIHGFSQRVLRDRAFESGALFDVELVTGQDELIQAAADDWWRSHFINESRWPAALAAQGDISTEKLAGFARAALHTPDVRVTSDAEGDDRSAVELLAAFEAELATAGKIWTAEQDELRAMFGAGVKWPKGIFAKDDEMDRHFAAITRLFAGQVSGLELGCLLAFAQSNLDEHKHGSRKKEVVPQHEFFACCERLAALSGLWTATVRSDAVKEIGERLAAGKLARKVQSFDDLLTRARAALRSGAGAALASELRRAFRAALIDEFQDTDPVQWEIFSTVFGESDGNGPAPYLFLIGDPKQSIYGFRGADVFTYLAAARAVKHRYSLDTNWRSERPLVQAVNGVFAQRPDAFVINQIAFHPVLASERAENTPLLIDGQRPAPLVFWMTARDTDGKPVDKGEARPAIIDAVVAEIVRLLSGIATVNQTPLQPRQIAVLVRSKFEADAVQHALADANVPGVCLTQESVFATHEAAELFRVLTAMTNPGDERLLCGAAACVWLSGMARLDEGEGGDGLGALRERMNDWLATWESRGFTVAFRRLLSDGDARAKLLAGANGERALTNLLHLGQLLHRAAEERGFGVGGLMQWFARQLNGDDAQSDEHLLRLERDDEAVQILTMHRSKGLQFEVVFCPFSWAGISEDKKLTRDGLQFHDETTHERILNLGPDSMADQLPQRRREEAAENTRLFYVALTRAIRRCYVVWGALKDAESSAPAWLLHASRGNGASAGEWKLDFKNVTDAQLQEDLLTLAGSSRFEGKPVIAVEPLPEPAGLIYQPMQSSEAALQVRELESSLKDDWRLLAFSTMTSGAEPEFPDHDSGTAVAVQDVAPTGMFAFPSGTRAGTCLHKIFERLDFANADETAIQEMVRGELRAHAIHPEIHQRTVLDMIREVLHAPLGIGKGEWKLAEIENADRINELELHCPLRALSQADLAKVLRHHGRSLPGPELPARIEELHFSAAGGWLTGFIDLVVRRGGKFYLLDWKSNWLGNTFADYEPAKLAKAMTQRLYPLQYLLYTVALDRWLRARLGDAYSYEENFGGVYYLFLRGVTSQQRSSGIFFDRPSPDLVDELGAALLADGKERDDE